MKKKCRRLALFLALTMILTIFPVCFCAETVEAASAVSTGSYYFNNKSGGYFLGRSSTTASTSSVKAIYGKVSSIRPRASWYVTMVDATYCTLRSSSTSTYYLSSSSSGTVQYVNRSSVNNYCLWSIVMTGQGITIKNKVTGMYLYQSSTNIKSSKTLSSASYWRAVLTSNYGNSASYHYRELSSFSVADTSVKVDASKALSISKSPTSGTISWASISDFTFKSSNTAIATVNSSGRVTGKAPGKTMITITHKPTGSSRIIYITVYADSGLFGTANDGHDHSSSLISARGYMNDNSGFTSNYYTYSAVHTKSAIKNILQYSRFFISRTHGLNFTSSGDNTGIQIDSTNNKWLYMSELYDFGSSTVKCKLSYLKICTFVGCYTAAGDTSIAKAANRAGANASVGFTKTINCNYANKWTCTYAQNISKYKSVSEACYAALHNGWYVLNVKNNLDSYKIFGNDSMTL